MNAPGAMHEVDLPIAPAEAMRLLGETAEGWGAIWEPRGATGGQLALPARAGLRRGVLEGPVHAMPTAEGTHIRFDVESSHYHVQYSAFVLLLLGGLGGLLGVVAPLAPALWPLVPVGVMLALGAWFLVVSRLHQSGAEDFLAALVTEASRPERE